MRETARRRWLRPHICHATSGGLARQPRRRRIRQRRHLFDAFAPVVAAMASIAEDVSDTDLALRNDLMLEFLDVYAIAKVGNRNGQYDAFLDSVAPIFARGPRTPATPPP